MQKFFRMRRDAKKGEWKMFEKEKTALQKKFKNSSLMEII